jgi:hypothetical protein
MSELLTALEPYPILKECFSKYVSWICDNDVEAFHDHVLVRKLKYDEGQPLRQLEELLETSRRIIGLRPIQFARTFGFLDDLVTADPEKIHDILAEPLFAIDLDRRGFASIEKLKAKSGDGEVLNLLGNLAGVHPLRCGLSSRTWAGPGSIKGGTPWRRDYQHLSGRVKPCVT